MLRSTCAVFCLLAVALLSLAGCSGPSDDPPPTGPPARIEEDSSEGMIPPAPAPAEQADPAPADAPANAPVPENPAPAAPAGNSPAETEPGTAAAGEGQLDAELKKLVVPPPWLEEVTTSWDMSKPWKEGRIEIRRLLGENTEPTRREALKLMCLYREKGDIGDGHEYPMYTHLGGEDVWSVRAHEEFLAGEHKENPIHARLSLAALYTGFGEFERAEQQLELAMSDLPKPPWQTQRKADVHDALGDLYTTWRRVEDAKANYELAQKLYPTARPPYGGHLLRRRADKVRAKLELLVSRGLSAASLKDGTWQHTALGYSGDVAVTVVVKDGKVADISVKHKEKIDQGAAKIIPRRIVEQQTLQVDGVSGATVTKDAVITGTYEALRKAGL